MVETTPVVSPFSKIEESDCEMLERIMEIYSDNPGKVVIQLRDVSKRIAARDNRNELDYSAEEIVYVRGDCNLKRFVTIPPALQYRWFEDHISSRYHVYYCKRGFAGITLSFVVPMFV